jgi:hypothetical protein
MELQACGSTAMGFGSRSDEPQAQLIVDINLPVPDEIEQCDIFRVFEQSN